MHVCEFVKMVIHPTRYIQSGLQEHKPVVTILLLAGQPNLPVNCVLSSLFLLDLVF